MVWGLGGKGGVADIYAGEVMVMFHLNFLWLWCGAMVVVVVVGVVEEVVVVVAAEVMVAVERKFLVVSSSQ